MSPIKKGDQIGDWVIESRLGDGAMASVYQGRHTVSQKMVAAIKIFRPDNQEQLEKWFSREIEALTALRHPNIVRILHPGSDKSRGIFYLAMELVEGETLRKRLDRGPLSAPEARSIFAALADAMSSAHTAHIFHRDLKPSNIILRQDITPVILDFGIATTADPTLRTTTAVGTPVFMAPELFDEGPVDPALADVYSLGVMLYEALTGKRAFFQEGYGEERVIAVVRQKMQVEYLDPGEGVGSELRQLVRLATDRNPRHRPPTMADFARVLKEPGSLTRAIQNATRPPPGSPSPSAPQSRRRELWAWIGGVAVVSLLLALVGSIVTWLVVRYAP